MQGGQARASEKEAPERTQERAGEERRRRESWRREDGGEKRKKATRTRKEEREKKKMGYWIARENLLGDPIKKGSIVSEERRSRAGTVVFVLRGLFTHMVHVLPQAHDADTAEQPDGIRIQREMKICDGYRRYAVPFPAHLLRKAANGRARIARTNFQRPTVSGGGPKKSPTGAAAKIRRSWIVRMVESDVSHEGKIQYGTAYVIMYRRSWQSGKPHGMQQPSKAQHSTVGYAVSHLNI
ncbi:hypothetical protein ASPWEDRAFT_66004 [Aspergillus wentii DTO 134E9]|uniref:Uncharacterized protein n=1 Tax=Aspergillus wentii DTO 134E9 TaxID=1073089 RepID=A0A1L9RW12_ASPWE|nr:uncharacterized protein ASPWEDRAFT_66004 [Aspergillus wentii DTO 134E9]OJJ39116.1 hypothetical protein ASPWEDRAFT_66004 [Aspergillus wentii DTO 134E9]